MNISSLRLKLKNDLSAIARSAEAIEAEGASRGWPAKWILNVNLSLDELISNVISYGYRDDDEHEMLVTLTERDGTLTVVLEDDGVAFDPFTDAPDADLESGLKERELRGLGVHFVRSFIDEVAYERRAGRNRTTLFLGSQEPVPVPRANPSPPLGSDSEDMEELSRMEDSDLRVAALDPLDLDDLFASLAGNGVPDLDDTERRYRNAAQRILQRRWSREEAQAGLRDLGMIASILERRYRIHPCEAEIVSEALAKLGETAREVPRETVFSYGPRNPSGSRMRTFSTLPEERIFILSISKAARCLPECIRCLYRASSAATSDVAEHLMQATMALESLVSALVRVKRTVPPALFSAEIAPFFPERQVAEKHYLGPTAAQMGVLVVDRLLFGTEMTGRHDYKAYSAEMSQYMPWELRNIEQRRHSRPSLLDMAREGRSFDLAGLVCLRELFQVLYKFRVPHLRLAEASFASRPRGAKGSGGYDPDFLNMLAEFTQSSIDELSKLIDAR